MPEYGDPDNARSWTNAIVVVAFPDEAGEYPADPATVADEWPAGWELAGLLDGGQGFVTSRTSTITDDNAWGQILISSVETGVKTTRAFTALEQNEVVDRLEHIEDGVQYQRGPERVKIGFETIDLGRGVTQRRISKYQAEVRINGDSTENEGTSERHPFIATIFPDTDQGLWIVQRSEAVGS